jgi:transcriptional regulator with XRE-family HTH domain
MGFNLKELRNKAGLSQVALANLADVSVQTIKDIEAGRRGAGLKALEGISRAIGVSINDLQSGIELQVEHIKLRSISDFKRSINSIPDDIFESAAKYSEDDKVWEMVRAAFQAREMLEAEKVDKTKKA